MSDCGVTDRLNNVRLIEDSSEAVDEEEEAAEADDEEEEEPEVTSRSRGSSEKHPGCFRYRRSE